MSSPGTPRFRFLAKDGTEVTVASVEALSSHLEAGELGPETSLFDAGTGRWARAGDVPVFQFIREELRAEGRLPEEEPELLVFPDPPPEATIEPAGDFEPIEHDGGEPGGVPEGDHRGEPGGAAPIRPLAPPTVDPFEFHLPLSNPLDPLEGRPPVSPAEPTPSGPDSGPPAGPGLEGAEAGAPPEAEAPAQGEDVFPPEPWFEDRPLAASAGPTTERASDVPGTAPGAGDPGTPGAGADALESEALETEALERGSREEREEELLGQRDPGDDDGESDTLEARLDRVRSRHAVEDPDIDASPLHAWLTQGPAASGASKPGASTSEGPPPPARDPSSSERPDLLDAEEGGGHEEAPLQIRTAWEDAADGPDPRAAWIAARRQRRNARVMAGAAALLILIVGGAAIVTGVRTDANGLAPVENGGPGTVSPATGGATEPGSAGFTALEGVDLPPDLEELAALLWQELPGRIDLLVDSIRVEAGLPDAPPREWLSGVYLASAGDFGEVVTFWEGYGSFVENLASRDAELLEEAATRILEGPGPGETGGAFATAAEGDRDRLLAYVMARHERMRDARLDRYLHLGRTAQAALDLHAFLEQNSDAIAHAPAIGQGVSSDPVLEAVTETPEVRREMERHLDLVFEALDRTRRGGQPSLAGLRVELFESLGRPL